MSRTRCSEDAEVMCCLWPSVLASGPLGFYSLCTSMTAAWVDWGKVCLSKSYIEHSLASLCICFTFLCGLLESTAPRCCSPFLSCSLPEQLKNSLCIQSRSLNLLVHLWGPVSQWPKETWRWSSCSAKMLELALQVECCAQQPGIFSCTQVQNGERETVKISAQDCHLFWRCIVWGYTSASSTGSITCFWLH